MSEKSTDPNPIVGQFSSRSASRVLQALQSLVARPLTRWLLQGVLLLFLITVPQLLSGNYWIRVLVQAGLYTMMALGLNLIAGQAGLLSLGYIAFYAVGAYTYGLLASRLHGIHFPHLIVILPLAGLISSAFGAVLAIPTVSLASDYLVVVTVAFSEILRILVSIWRPLTGGPTGIYGIDRPQLFSLVLSTPRHFYYLILFLCVVEVFLFSRLGKSRLGRAWNAIRNDEVAAKTMGLDVKRLKILVCALGAAPAGMAGVLFAGLQLMVAPANFIVDESLVVLSMMAIGGVGNIPGVVLGAVLLTLLPEPLRKYAEAYRLLIFGAILTLMAIFRPQGLWPKSRRVPQAASERRPVVDQTS